MTRWLSVLPACLAALACAPERSAVPADSSGGTLVISSAADPDVLVPPLIATLAGKQVADQIFDRLADIGDDLNTVGDEGFRPALAERWTWGPDSLSVAFHLRPGARWHDGRPVTAQDVQFTYALYTHPEVGSPVATALANIDSVTIRDSMTAVIWYARQTSGQFFETTYYPLILPRHLLDTVPPARLRESAFAQQPVGSGRFRFANRAPAVAVEIISDTGNYRGRAQLDRVLWVVAPDFNTAATRFMSKEADVFEALRPEQLEEVARTTDLRALILPSLDYAFVQFNLRDPSNTARPHALFSDRSLRRALSMAVDRFSLVRNVFDTLALVAIGPVSRGLRLADTTVEQIPFDAARAAQLLDSLGWRASSGDGARRRGPQPLAFTLLVPSSSRNRVRMAVLMQEQFRRVGVRMNIEQLEYVAFTERSRRGRFDAAFGAWHIDVGPAGIRQTWGTAGSRSRTGLNDGSYENPEFDAQIDSALTASDPAQARAHFRVAMETIVADAPAIWMYEPRTVVGLHSRLRPEHVRADAWWAGLADWSVDPANRLPRDDQGPVAASR